MLPTSTRLRTHALLSWAPQSLHLSEPIPSIHAQLTRKRLTQSTQSTDSLVHSHPCPVLEQVPCHSVSSPKMEGTVPGSLMLTMLSGKCSDGARDVGCVPYKVVVLRSASSSLFNVTAVRAPAHRSFFVMTPICNQSFSVFFPGSSFFTHPLPAFSSPCLLLFISWLLQPWGHHQLPRLHLQLNLSPELRRPFLVLPPASQTQQSQMIPYLPHHTYSSSRAPISGNNPTIYSVHTS